jgi:hypothetical protein
MSHGTYEHVVKKRVLNIMQRGKDSPNVAACWRYFAVEQHSDGVIRFPVLKSYSFPIIGLFSVLSCQLIDS